MMLLNILTGNLQFNCQCPLSFCADSHKSVASRVFSAGLPNLKSRGVISLHLDSYVASKLDAIAKPLVSVRLRDAKRFVGEDGWSGVVFEDCD